MIASRRLSIVVLASALALALAACKKEEAKVPPADTTAKPPPAEVTTKPPLQTDTGGTAPVAPGKKLSAKITTDKGVITCELFSDKAPKTVASFVELARGTRAWKDPLAGGAEKKEKFFDGLAFHRVIPDFMIQGGDPLSRDYKRDDIGSGGPGYEFANENLPDLLFDKPGRLAMANAGRDTNGSQFFITEGPKPQLNGGYTIFGQCDNIDVVKAIARVPVDHPDHNKPLEPITMKVEILEP